MIEVDRVGKTFGRVRAVHDVRFAVRPGEVAAVLGANGAGKTTTLRMVAGVLQPDHGSIRLAGHDVVLRWRQARQCLGYLPESAACYPEMTPSAYLHFRARLFPLHRARRTAVDRALATCGLSTVRSRRIGSLSKGYRQRVALAAALLHDPPVLVLDEPTSSLDPEQALAVRDTIRQLAADTSRRTILMSSHLLPEVEAVCHRVIFMMSGQVRLEGTPAELARLGRRGRVVVELRSTDAPPGGSTQDTSSQLAAALSRIPGVRRVEPDADASSPWCRFIVEPDDESIDLREPIALAARRAGAVVRELRPVHASLEQVFVDLVNAGAAAGRGGAS